MDPNTTNSNTDDLEFLVIHWNKKNKTKDEVTKDYLKKKRKTVKKRKLLKKAFGILTSQLQQSNDLRRLPQDEMQKKLKNFLTEMMKDTTSQLSNQIYDPVVLDDHENQSGNEISNPIILKDN